MVNPKSKIKFSTLAAVTLKAAQQGFYDLDPSISENTTADLVRYTGEQFARLGASGAAAYTLDRISAGFENLISLPKPLKGLAPTLLLTIGIGALHHNYGQHIGFEETQNIWEATNNVLISYKDSLTQLAQFDLSAHAGYLTGALTTAFSGLRWGKNILTTLSDYSDRKKQKRSKK